MWIGREHLLFLQVEFETLIPAVRAVGINGNDIAECWDGEDFTDLFPLSFKAQDICACFEKMMGYFATHFLSKQRVSILVPTCISVPPASVTARNFRCTCTRITYRLPLPCQSPCLITTPCMCQKGNITENIEHKAEERVRTKSFASK